MINDIYFLITRNLNRVRYIKKEHDECMFSCIENIRIAEKLMKNIDHLNDDEKKNIINTFINKLDIDYNLMEAYMRSNPKKSRNK